MSASLLDDYIKSLSDGLEFLKSKEDMTGDKLVQVTQVRGMNTFKLISVFLPDPRHKHFCAEVYFPQTGGRATPGISGKSGKWTNKAVFR